MPEARNANDPPALPAAPEWPEAFGSARQPPPGYEAFGRAEEGEKAEAKNHRPRRDESKAPKKRERDREPEDDSEKSEDPKGEKNGEDDEKDEEKKPAGPPAYKRPAVLITVAVVLLVAIAVGVIWWLYARQFESTDDAYIDSHVTVISPQVSAPVKTLHVDDNQLVRKGDLLMELDPTDYRVALEQAKAAANAAEGRLGQSQAQIAAAKASYDQSTAEVDAAQVQFENATRDLQRYQDIDERARSQQQLDNASTAQKNAEAQLAQAKAKQALAKANIETSEAAVKASAGDLEKARADVHRAEINLGYCRIVAPADGRVTLRTIEPGAYIAAGQAAFSLVSPDVWVIANFKETQLKRMRPGQSVTIEVDAFPGKKFNGHVDSIQAGSGSRFSVLPAENATGNFVKIVQRVPVKIWFDHDLNTDDAHLLSPGLSVTPKVKVR